VSLLLLLILKLLVSLSLRLSVVEMQENVRPLGICVKVPYAWVSALALLISVLSVSL